MKKSIFFTLLLFLLSGMMLAQITNYYTFSTGTTTYTAITGTAITSIQADDALSEAIDIGFSFPYGLNAYSQVKVSSNGWIGLGTSQTGSNLSNMLNSTAYCPVLAPLWDDTGLQSGNCMYLLTGTAPNRVFTIQYSNLAWYYGSGTAFNFQVKLLENGTIQYVYGPTTSTPSSPSASIGINMSPGGTNYFISVTPGNPATSSSTAENTSVGSWPGNGNMYIFSPPAQVPNDMACMAITGNATPTAGTASTYTLTIRNFGTANQAAGAYTVKVMSGTTELASVAGPALAASTTTTVPLPVTFTNTGPQQIFGRVVLTGDENPINDNCSPMNVNVQAPGTVAVTIGAGNETSYLVPLNMWYMNSLSETIYQAAEINLAGLITGIQYYNQFVTNLPGRAIRIWMTNTTLTDLSAGWIPSPQMTLMFQGTVDFPSGSNNINIPFTTPFVYTGGNLAILAERTDTAYYSTSDVFLCQTVGTTRSRYVYQDETAFDPTNPPTGNITGQFAKTTLFFAPPGTDPTFGAGPNPVNFGTILLNNQATQPMAVYNSGGGSYTVNTITITGAGAGQFALQNVPTLPVTLNSMQSMNFNVNFVPTAAGTFTANLTITTNLAGSPHTVPLNATCMDPTIYTSPYAQSFDAVTPPAIPIDWQTIVTGTTSGYLRTVTSTPHSAPNDVYFYNSESSTATMLLIAPILSTQLPTNTMRIKFWGKSASAGYTIKVGVMTSATDAATFTEIQSIPLTTTWTEYVVGFQTYTGAGRYIALKHGLGSTYQGLYVDDVTIEVIPTNDIAAQSIVGNTTPSVGAASNYTVTVFNWGTATPANYQVKLFSSTNTELASVAGPTVAPGTSVNAVLSWTPTTAGATYIYGKVVMTGDQNSLNDQTANYNVIVQQEGTSAVTIGAGDQLANIPVNMFWMNSIFETIFQANEIAMGGAITGVSFYNNFVTNLPNMPTKIWLGMTAQDNLSTGWIPVTQLTSVFDGTVTYPSGQNTITIPFTTPFIYGGTNLIMFVQRPLDTTYYSSSDYFQCQTVGTNRSLELHQDGTAFDPTNPPAATPMGQFPKTTFYFIPTGPNPQFGVAPTSKNWGQVLMNSTNNQTFTIYNSGGAPYTVNSITIAGSPMFSLQNLPTLPYTVNAGQYVTFVGRYQPTAAGTHTGTITITDNLAARSDTRSTNRVEHTVALSGTCIDPTIYTSPYVQNFDTNVTPPGFPIDWSRLVQTTSTGYVQTSTSGTPHSAPNHIIMYNASDANANLFAIAPVLATNFNVQGMRIKFWAKASSANYVLNVGIMSDITNAATYTNIQTIALTTTYTEYVVGYQTYTGTGRNFVLAHGNGGTGRTLYIDDITIENTPQNDLAALSVVGNTTPSVGMATNYTVSVFNWGTNAQNNYLVKLFNSNNVELSSVAGPNIAPGTTANVVVGWTPSIQGVVTIYGKVVLTGDQNPTNDQTPNFSVSVQAAGTLVVTVGDGSQTAYMPLDYWYMNSLFETIYTQAEIGWVGMITGISLYNTFVTNLPNMPVNIWMANTNLTNLSGGWVPSTQMTQVFSGNVTFPSGQNTITITFPQPFLLLENNLLVMMERAMDTTYYSSSDYFYCQTVGANRTLFVWADSPTDYDPANPPAGTTPTGQFPKTSFFMIPGGVGHLQGTVLGAGNQPLAGVNVQIVNWTQTTTDANGHYEIHNIIDGTYQVTMSRYGYYDNTQTVVIPEDETVTHNVTMTQMPTVILTGTIVASDNPTVGLANSHIHLTGYETYDADTNDQGVLSIPGVYANQTYSYTASHAGYSNVTGTVVVGATNQNMGTVTLPEIAYSPVSVQAVQNTNGTQVNLTWQAPDPNSVNVTQSFEMQNFPPTDWSQVITDTGPANTLGVFPTWCRMGALTISGQACNPTEGLWQAGMWWSYNHQDEWLITPQFSCPQGAEVSFDSYVFLGSVNGDHYYLEVTTDNGVTWNHLWDATAQTGGWNYYATPISLDLDAFTGQQIRLAWHADDPNATSDGMWYVWFIDNVIIGNATAVLRFSENDLTVRTANHRDTHLTDLSPNILPSKAKDLGLHLAEPVLRTTPQTAHNRHSRSIEGYKIYRLIQGQELNELAWTVLTPEVITTTNYTDLTWAPLPAGTYKFAVKAYYTNNVFSLASFSNAVVKQPVQMGTIAGWVRNAQNQPIVGAIVTNGVYSGTSNANGVYSVSVPVGTYALTASATGYSPLTHEDINVNAGQTTVVNFSLTVGNVDDVIIARTELQGNHPNPFNPETLITFDIKQPCPVTITIYNMKGQLIRTLVSETKGRGHHSIVWNGTDDMGNHVGCGIYTYKMQAGNYKAIRRMMLLK